MLQFLVNMALIALGVDIVDIRKSAGRSTYSKNRYGNYKRERIKPKNPKTGAQSFIRAGFKEWAQTFRTFSQSVIAGFNDLGALIKKSGRTGFKHNMTGETLYIGLSQNINMVSGTPLTAAPDLALDAVAPLTLPVFAIASGVVTFAASAAPISGTAALCSASGELSPAINFNSKYKNFTVILSTDTLPKTITTDYVAAFGPVPAAGKVVYFRHKVIDKATGFCSGYITQRVVAS